MDKLLEFIKNHTHKALMPAALANGIQFGVLLAQSLQDGVLDNQEIGQLLVNATSGLELIILVSIISVLKFYSLKDKK